MQHKNRRRRGLAFKLIIYIFTSVAFVFIFIFLYNYRFSKLLVEKKLKESAASMTKNGVSQIEKILYAVQKIPDNYVPIVESTGLTDSAIASILQREIAINPEIYGAALAFEPYLINPKQKYYMAYDYRKNGQTELLHPGGERYDYFTMDWYQIPKELGRPVWSEPYFDEGAGNTIMSTYSVPLYRDTGNGRQFIGILTADVSMDWLQEFVNSIKVYQTGYGFLISQNGTIVTHPNKDLIMNETIFSIAEAQHSEQLREIGRNMIHGGTSFAELEYRNVHNGKLSWLAYAPVSLNGWSIGIVFPVDEFMADINSLFTRVLILGVGGLLIILLVIILISRTITSPLRSLSQASKKIAGGNFNVELPVIHTRDELKELHDSFDYMQRKLAEYIENLKDTTAAREKIESELRIAREIQMGMIPHIFPPFPNLKQIDLFAMLQPAKEVGGDLYDFFLLDASHLCFAIGDVSGKGVPASLFMAVTRTLLRSVADKNGSPAEFTGMLNESLSFNNESSMFVTFFVGVINLNTGELNYTNAGHNPPVLIRENGEVKLFEITKSIPVGLFEDFKYTQSTLYMQKGDKLFLYTDGVTEAENCDQKLYSEECLIDVLRQHAGASPVELIRWVEQDIAAHVDNNPQSDDLTMMSIVYYGN